MKVSRLYYLQRRLRCCLFCLLPLLLCFPLTADIITLHNGRELEGRVIKENRASILFRFLNGTKRNVPIRRVKAIRIGFLGIPGCYMLKEKVNDRGKEICNVKLIERDHHAIGIAEGKHFFRRRSISTQELRSVQLHLRAPFYYASLLDYFLEQGDHVILKSKKKTWRGHIEQKTKNYIFLRKDDSIAKISKKALQKLTINFGTEQEEGLWHALSYTLPGLHQYKQSKHWKGTFLTFGSAACLVGLTWEYLQALQASRSIREDQSNYEERLATFEKHQSRQRYYVYGLIAFYSWHVLDSIFRGGKKAVHAPFVEKQPLRTGALQWHMALQPSPGRPHFHSYHTWQASVQIGRAF